MTNLAADLQTLSSALESNGALGPSLHHRWRNERRDLDGLGEGLDPELAAVADRVNTAMGQWGQHEVLADVFAGLGRELAFTWCAANAANPDIHVFPALSLATASGDEGLVRRGQILARNRVAQGPLGDALACLTLIGDGAALSDQGNFEALARVEILIWEAGARGLQLPSLGRWIWSDAATFEALVATPARGSLRGRVLAARCLEIAACGMSQATDPQLVGRTLQVMQPLLLHPEPIVWIHAARSFGRLAGVFEPLEATLLDWVHGGSQVLRQRALTAFASLPKDRLSILGHELESILDDPQEEAWGLAAAAAATPYLFYGRRRLWDRLADRILHGDGGAVAARALGRGLGTLWRRNEDRDVIEPIFRRLRRMARRVTDGDVDDWRRWLELIAVTDPIDTAERDPLDLETGLENLVRLAAHYDSEEGDVRAARFAATLGPTLAEAREVVLGGETLRRRAGAINAFEGCARSLALRLWGPMIATRPSGEALVEPDLEETWSTLARAPAELLDEVRSRRHLAERDEGFERALEVLALKLGGYALDACGEEHHLGPGRGATAHQTCLWLRKLEGLDGTKEVPVALQAPLSALFWRLVDTTRGTSLGEVDDVAWLGPFAAWWALVIDQPSILLQLANALPMIADGVLEQCCELAAQTRRFLEEGGDDGVWKTPVLETLIKLKANETELGVSLAGFADSLSSFEEASGLRPDLEAMTLDLVMASGRLQSALQDPVRALHPAQEGGADDDTIQRASVKNGPRLASVVARAIKKRDASLLEVWFASLGPTASGLVERAVDAAMKRTPPPPPIPKKKEPKMVVGYELIKPLGEGGIGSVWLVRKPGADRFFVLKIPKADVLASASDTEREGILSSFTEEARALAGLYHPNVANIIDRGVAEGMPYLVLEYLIGADLKMYSTAKRMSLFELRRVVLESCAGLTALHNAGLVHRDIKPANIWLRLPLAGGVRFDPQKHRDPALATPLATVLIDFGMVRAMKVPADVGGRFVAGTPGYIAPEQVLDPVELDGRADVYALAGTIYNVTTGRTFFDDISDKRERIIAHMRRDAMENEANFKHFPAALIKLLREATARDPRDRPTPLEFSRAFLEIG